MITLPRIMAKKCKFFFRNDDGWPDLVPMADLSLQGQALQCHHDQHLAFAPKTMFLLYVMPNFHHQIDYHTLNQSHQ